MDATPYAGFGKRVAAASIDAIIVVVVFGGMLAEIAAVISVYVFPLILSNMFPEGADPAQAVVTALFGMPVLLVLLFGVCATAVYMAATWLYVALMESSRFQGTLGKLAVGIKVTDREGNPISFGRATGRHFGKLVTALGAFSGYIMVAFTEKKQALHDIMAGCLVVKK